MIIDFQWDDLMRRSSIRATTEDYDAYPRPARLSCELVPRTILSGDRLAVAGALAFSQAISGHLSVGMAIGKPVADAIRGFFGERQVDLDAVAMRPKEPQRGTGAFLLGRAGVLEPKPKWIGFDEARQIAFVDYRGADRSGASFAVDRLEVPSNAWRFSAGFDVTDVRHWYPQIALAVLMASEFEIGEIWLPDTVVQDDRLYHVSEMLKSIDISMSEWETAAA